MIDYGTLFLQTKNLSLLLVEDYEPLRNDMAEVLEDFFKTVRVASDGTEALKIYQEYQKTHPLGFDLVISDIQMPLMNGVELGKALRDINADQQIVILSAHTDSDYLLKLINLGIAQFITKPIKHEELLDTLYYVSKKITAAEPKNPDVLIVNLGENYLWDKEKLLLKQDDITIELTRHELLLMQLLVRNEEQVCTNDDIMQDFYANGVDINEKNIRNLVFKLRKKLPEKVIGSVYGMGYKFTPLD